MTGRGIFDKLVTMAKKQSKFLSGKRIDPTPISKKTNLADLIDESTVAVIGSACNYWRTT